MGLGQGSTTSSRRGTPATRAKRCSARARRASARTPLFLLSTRTRPTTLRPQGAPEGTTTPPASPPRTPRPSASPPPWTRPARGAHDRRGPRFLGWRSDRPLRGALTTRLTRERGAAAVVAYTWTGHAKDPDRAATEATLRARYDRGVAALDAGVERTLATLDAAELPGRTVVFVVTDHGEAFGENGALGHGRWLVDPITRMLLLVRAPGHFKAGVIRGSCGGIDLTPTILDLVGLPSRSAARAARSSRRPRPRGGEPVLAEDFRRQPADPATPGPDITFRVVTVRTERAKLHLLWDPRTDTTEATLFDLVADPAEAHPLPPTDLARFGPAFVAACARARDHVATFHGRTDNHGNGRFQGE
jgi:arylsulfatase A-like enzyme